MRVCNDDEVVGGKGFGSHPHSDMEIVTVVLRGAIKHEDNLGNVEVSSAGEVQRMSAGSGIIHAEYNASETDDLNFLQLWFMPSERGLSVASAWVVSVSLGPPIGEAVDLESEIDGRGNECSCSPITCRLRANLWFAFLYLCVIGPRASKP